jgi:polyisoprenoid-binding protein YceI
MSRRTKIIAGTGVTVAILVVVGLLVFEDLFGFGGPASSGASAPTLEAASQQVVYRIDTAQSSVTYSVQEIFAGQPVSTAVGTTRQVAGDILVDLADLSRSQVGTIVINVEQFESDSGLRDRRIRRDYLESSAFPEAVFVPTSVTGFPEAFTQGETVTLEMTGDLTVRETTLPVTWTVTGTLEGDMLTGTAAAAILMSDFGIGPINIAGFVETADEVLLEFRFVAAAVTAQDAAAATVQAEG